MISLAVAGLALVAFPAVAGAQDVEADPVATLGQQTNLLLGFALCEATGLFGLVVAFILMFAF